MQVILGKRDYEQTGTGKYPKYNLEQMNRFVIPESSAYTGIQVVMNVKCFDLFGKYKDEINDDQKKILDKEIEKEYGMHNVNMDDLIDWDKFDYNKETEEFELK